MDGLLLIDKPTGVTSFDVVRRVREATDEDSVGHTGTLDREATGLLCMMVGRCTKLRQYLPPQDSVYETEVTLGARTDSLDRAGDVVERADWKHVDEADLRAALEGHLGRFEQRPPAYSAVKVDGERASDRARRGELDEADLEAREVRVERLEVADFSPPTVELVVECGPGFYVRSLARDLAEDLDTCGYASAIHRRSKGSFDLSEAVALDELNPSAAAEAILPPREMVRELPSYEVGEEDAVAVGYGQRLDLTAAEVEQMELEEGDPFAVVDHEGELAAAAVLRTDLDGETLQPRRVLKPSG